MDDALAMQTVTGLIREMKPGLADGAIDGDARLETDLAIGSLDRLILLTRIEEASKVRFASLQQSGLAFGTVDDLVRLLVDHG